MLWVTSVSELFQNRRDQTIRKGNAMSIWIQLPATENHMKISIKKSTFDLP